MLSLEYLNSCNTCQRNITCLLLYESLWAQLLNINTNKMFQKNPTVSWIFWCSIMSRRTKFDFSFSSGLKPELLLVLGSLCLGCSEVPLRGWTMKDALGMHSSFFSLLSQTRCVINLFINLCEFINLCVFYELAEIGSRHSDPRVSPFGWLA